MHGSSDTILSFKEIQQKCEFTNWEYLLEKKVYEFVGAFVFELYIAKDTS